MPAGRPTSYKPEYCERVIELGKLGKSQTQIACELDVDKASMYRWADAHEEFRTALTRAKQFEQDWWENAGQQGMVADKFNATVWSKSMQARFREDYTERKEIKQEGEMKHTHKLTELTDEELAAIAAGSGS